MGCVCVSACEYVRDGETDREERDMSPASRDKQGYS